MTISKPKISCIYLDMDGVIADFEKRYKEIYRIHPKEAEKSNKYRHFFDDFIENNNFATLEPMEHALEAIVYLKKLHVPTQILSSTANEEKYDAISKQKMIWLQKYGVTFNPIFVPGKRLKQEHAAPDRILIDDTESVINQWNAAGGIGILHKDWETTITILKLYV